MSTDKELPETIYLIDMGDEITWCEDPAPGVEMDADDAVEYVRADTVSQSEWVSVNDEMPENGNFVTVSEEHCYRYFHYKATSQQAKKGIVGRWQKWDGYGFHNCEAPKKYKPQPPKDTNNG